MWALFQSPHATPRPPFGTRQAKGSSLPGSVRGHVSGIFLAPLLINLVGLVQFTGYETVIRRLDIEALALAHPVAQLKRLPEVLAGRTALPHVVVRHTQRGIGAGEVRIQFHGPLVKRN